MNFMPNKRHKIESCIARIKSKPGVGLPVGVGKLQDTAIPSRLPT